MQHFVYDQQLLRTCHAYCRNNNALLTNPRFDINSPPCHLFSSVIPTLKGTGCLTTLLQSQTWYHNTFLCVSLVLFTVLIGALIFLVEMLNLPFLEEMPRLQEEIHFRHFSTFCLKKLHTQKFHYNTLHLSLIIFLLYKTTDHC